MPTWDKWCGRMESPRHIRRHHMQMRDPQVDEYVQQQLELRRQKH